MQHPLKCRCGTIRGWISNPRGANRAICYCKDCQAFAHFLGQEKILDPQGGTDVIQILPKNLTFTQGIEALACIRLTEKGMFRWYASCCNTPIGNTLPNFKISFVGLVHNCVEGSDMALRDSSGPVRARVNTQGATGEPKPKSHGTAAVIVRLMFMLLKARLDGSYRQTPFFLKDKGTPVVRPRVLSSVELANAAAR
jgi:Family of unknown function (DUF6151)